MFPDLDYENNQYILSKKYSIDDEETGILYKFGNGYFTQLHIDLPIYKDKVLFLGKDLTDEGQMDLIINNEEYIERRGYWVFPKIGLVISKDKEELFFFDESLLQNWLLVHRPITSW